MGDDAGRVEPLQLPPGFRIEELDKQAKAVLHQMGQTMANAIVTELLSKGDAVCNPSAYILQAMQNVFIVQSLALAAGPPMLGRQSSPELLEPVRSCPSFSEWAHMLDDRAVFALNNAGSIVAEAILEELRTASNRGDGIRNPSAFVVKAVGNAKPGTYTPRPTTTTTTTTATTTTTTTMSGGGGMANGNSTCTGPLFLQFQHTLDERALSALNEVGTVAAESILHELQFKGTSVRNPSAYVVKSVANAVAGSQTARSVGTADSGVTGSGITFSVERARSNLDDRALEALDILDLAISEKILKELHNAGQFGFVRNPSAYVLKSCANARRGSEDNTPEVESKRQRIV